MKVWILSKGGGGGRTPNLNFWYFILVALLNLVTEKFNPIFGLNFRKSLDKIHTFIFFFMDDLPKPDRLGRRKEITVRCRDRNGPN